MMSRVLPPEEWSRLEGTEAESVWPYFKPENTRILVVEEDGKIIGTWAMLRVVHAECIWIAPEYRGGFGVARRLLKGMRDIATSWGVSRVITASATPYVTSLIHRMGGGILPYESFVMPVEMAKKSTERLMEEPCRHP